MSVLVSEISRQEQADEALMEAAKNFGALLDNAIDGVFIAVGDGVSLQPGRRAAALKHFRTVYANRRAAEISGYGAEEVIGLSAEDVFPGDEMEKMKELHRRRLQGKRVPTSYDTVIIRKDGERVPVEISPNATMWQGQPAVMAFFRDVREEKGLEEALREARNAYDVIAKTMWAGIVATDPEGEIIEVSARMLELVGYARAEEVVGRSAYEFMAPEDREGARAQLKAGLASGAVRDFECTLVAKDGSRFPAEVNATLVVDSTGKEKALIGTVRDITGRKRAEESLRQSEETFRVLAENSPDGILITEAEGSIVYANKRAAGITAYSVSQLVSLPSKDLLHPDEVDKVEGSRLRALKGKRVAKAFETVVLRADGSTVPVKVERTWTPWQGRPAQVLRFWDISERRRREEALKRSIQELSAARIPGARHERDLLRRLSQRQSEMVSGTMRRAGLSAAARRLSSRRGEKDLLRAVCREACCILGFTRAAIVLKGSKEPLAAWPCSKDVIKPTARARLPGGTLLLEGKKGNRSMIGSFAAFACLALRHSLAERHMAELAMMESHHHLANTLQGVRGLLRMRCGKKCGGAPLRMALSSLGAAAAAHRLVARGKPANLVDLVAGLQSEAWGPMLAERGISLELRTVPVDLSGRSATCLATVLNELVMNAAEHAFPGGKVGSVEVRVSTRKGRLLLVVADDGVGLPEGRLSCSSFGLGLRIAKRMVEVELGGHIRITGTRGAVARVDIPLEGRALWSACAF